MDRRNANRTSALSLALMLAVAAIAARCDGQAASSGSFTDRNGARHDWSIASSHALVWDGRAYVPVGGRFAPRCLSDGATDEAWSHDVQDLALLKQRGILDLIIDPAAGAAAVTTAVWQRLLDHLDAEGFRYGIAFGRGVRSELTGTVVNPAAYRIADMRDGSEAGWDLPDADAAWFVIADSRDGTQVHAEGRARVREGHVAMTAGSRVSEGSVALLYPHKSLRSTPDGSLPDLWDGFDTYRDRLLQTLGGAKFGPGLRFFLDPLGDKIGLPNEADCLIPDSPGWRLEWEAFLSRKYQSPGALATAWALVERDFGDFRKAASLIPLWFRNKGVPFMLDPSQGTRLQVSGAESKFWSDFRECRDQSMVHYLSATAELLKRELADVPVVYTHTLHHSMFAVRSRGGGFDGLGISAYGSGARLVQGGADAAYSQVSDSARSLWLLTTETCDPSGAGGRPGYGSRDALFRDLDWLASAGSRGAFVRALRSPSGTDPRHAELMRAPEQLDWLSAYAARVAANPGGPAGGPRVLPFPAAASGYVQSGPIGSGGVWWVPSLAPGRALDFGSSYAGYSITLPEGEAVVVWSLTGPRDTRLSVPDPRKVQASSADGTPIELKADAKGRTVRLQIGEHPVVVKAQGQEVFPFEAVEDSLKQLRALVNKAAADKLPAQDYRYMLETAEERFKRKDLAAALGMCQQALAGIVELMQPYSWCEVEHASVQTFTEVVPVSGASAGMYLSLNSTANPPRDGYSVQVGFKVPADDTYSVWLACSPPSPSVSPFAWVVDTGETRLSSEARSAGGMFLGDRLGWLELGRIPLKAGAHSFTLRVTDRAAASGEFAFAADVLLVTRNPFVPRGTARPPAIAGSP